MSRIDFRTYRAKRRFSWLIFGIGLVLILGWQFCQRDTWNTLMSLNSPDRRPPETLNKLEDIKRTDRLLPILTPEMLDDFHDNSPLTKAETRVAMKVWNYLNATDTQTIRDASLGKVLFAQYLKQPNAYRGCVVRLQGTLRLAMRQTIPDILRKKPENSEDPDFGYDFDHYYELWFQPDDNLADPVLVNALEIPEGIPLDEEIRVPMVIDSVFFKMYLYESAQGMETAPCFYAKAPVWYYLPQASSGAKEKSAKKPMEIPFVYILGGAFLLGGILFRIIEKFAQPAPPEEALPETFKMPEVSEPSED